MNLAILSFTSGYSNRGMETIVYELASRLSKKHKITVFQAGSNYPPKPMYEIRFVDVNVDWNRFLKANFWRKFMIDYLAKKMVGFTRICLKEIRNEDIDIIMPVNGGWQVLLTKIFCIKHNKKMVITGQAGLGWNDRWNLFFKPDLFIASSKRNAKWAKEYSKNVKIVVIPNGVDLNEFKPKGKKINFNLPRPIILCVASDEEYKRVNYTIKAVSKLKSACLLVVGGGLNSKKIGRKNLGHKFLMKSYPHSQMPDVYRSCDIFTLASDSSEAFGISYIEALASSLTIVAPDDELRREILGQHATYVKDVEDTNEYSEKLKGALQKHKHRPEGFLKKYSWDAIAWQYEDVLTNLID